MSSNGEMALAKSLDNLANDHVNTQVIVQGSMITSIFGYMSNIENSTTALDFDEQKCAHWTKLATTGQEKAATKAAYWHSKYQVDSVIMNKEMGNQSSTVNAEEVMEKTQAENLNPVYSVLEYVAILFLTTSGLINKG